MQIRCGQTPIWMHEVDKNLLKGPGDPLGRAMAAHQMDATVTDVARELRATGFADHPAMAPVMTSAAPTWTLRMWATVLGSGGYQTPHIHPMGWLSGVYYVSLPEDMGSSGPQAGWIEFGAPPERFRVASPPQARAIEPRPGRLVLFPSYFHHGILPFVSGERRVSMAFDAVPSGRDSRRSYRSSPDRSL